MQALKIVFICSSFEWGKDGVGDYTRKLASELVKKGNHVAILAYHDQYILTNRVEMNGQNICDPFISVVRMPKQLNVKQKITVASEFINNFDPDIISLQYVPYGFQSKGLPLSLPATLVKAAPNRRWHIMFHELWQGEAIGSTYKEKFIGFIQKRIAHQLVNSLRVKQAFTNTRFFQICLRRENITSELLPVFSNLAKNSGINNILLQKLPLPVQQNRKDFIIATFFGSVHQHRDLLKKTMQLHSMVKNNGKKLFITHIGKGNLDPELLAGFTQHGIGASILGEQNECDITSFFSNIELGLSTYPKVLYEKSGSIAAMLNNGLPVILLRKGFEEDTRVIDELKELEEISSIDEFIHQPKTFSEKYSISATVEKYKELLAE